MGAVGAAVDQHEAAPARLDGGLEARHLPVQDDDAHGAVAADGKRRGGGVHLEQGVAVAQRQEQRAAHRDVHRGDQGQLGVLLPDPLVQLHQLVLAAHLDRIQRARHLPQRCRQLLHRMLAGDDLPARGQLDQPRGQVDRVAEHVAAFVRQDRAMVETDMDRQGNAGDGRQPGHAFLHVECGLHRMVGGGEQHHDFVADGLDHTPLRQRGARLHQRQAMADGGECHRVAGLVVEPRAVADVREHHGAVAWVSWRTWILLHHRRCCQFSGRAGRAGLLQARHVCMIGIPLPDCCPARACRRCAKPQVWRGAD
ncbi:hypothetical protein D3C72_917730 [compost metagenome]